MDPLRKRFAMFLLGCVPLRLALVYIVAFDILGDKGLKAMAVMAGVVAVGFITIFVGGLRRTGLETGGAPIWWNWLRPVHATLYGLFAYFAWTGNRMVAWKLLLLDVCIGLISFLVYHGIHGNVRHVMNL